MESCLIDWFRSRAAAEMASERGGRGFEGGHWSAKVLNDLLDDIRAG